MTRRLLPTIVATLFAVPGASLLAQNVPNGFVVDTLLATDLSLPNDCCFLPDGRVLIAESAGEVTVWAAGNAATVGMVPAVESGGERGLLSIAADPDFANNGYVYVYYSRNDDAFMHLDRFTCIGDLDDPTSTTIAFTVASRRIVLDALPDNAGNHNGGSARFGPDGRLYLTVGDDANSCGAQDVTTQVGCLLRLRLDNLPAGGSLTAPAFGLLDPGDNPLSSATDFRQLVLAHGLRNPFRMEIDPVTGNLYIGDVGQNAEEEYTEYVRPTGALPLVNFGWPWREGVIAGFTCAGSQPSGLIGPIASVSHSAGWQAIMGGPRYRNLGRGHDLGSAYEGSTFFHDFAAGELRRLVPNGSGWNAAPPVSGQPSSTNWGTGFVGVSSMRLGPDGALWFTQRNGNGVLRRIRPQGPIHDIVTVGGDGQFGPAGEPFAAPLVVRALDAQGSPLPGASVTFTVTGSGTLSAGTVVADASGLAQTTVTAATAGGAIDVIASTPGSDRNATFSLFARRLSVSHNGGQVNVTITNASNASSPQVPFLLLTSFPGSTVLPTVLGPICTDPFHALTVVIEDSIFGGGSLSGTGAVGTPGVVKNYVLPPTLLAGQLMSFQAVGIDPLVGWFRTNCEQHQF